MVCGAELAHGKHSRRNFRGVIHRSRACLLAASRSGANRQARRRLGPAGIMRDAVLPIWGSRARNTFAAALGVLLAVLFGTPAAKAAEISAAIAYLYSSVSIYPPSANAMTVCYGFVCRRREILDFTAGDRNAITQIMAAGRASAAAQRAAGQKGGVWVDRRIGPNLRTAKRAAE